MIGPLPANKRQALICRQNQCDVSEQTEASWAVRLKLSLVIAGYDDDRRVIPEGGVTSSSVMSHDLCSYGFDLYSSFHLTPNSEYATTLESHNSGLGSSMFLRK